MPFKLNAAARFLAPQGTPEDRNAIIIGTIRTAVPTAVGVLLTWLIVQVPAVGDAVEWVDAQFTALGHPEVNVNVILGIVAVTLVTAAYYRGVRWLGQRFPAVEKWLLGSSKTPSYTPSPTGPEVVDLPPGSKVTPTPPAP